MAFSETSEVQVPFVLFAKMKSRERQRSYAVTYYHLYVDMLSHVQLFVTPWTVAHQAPLSMGFPRLEYWTGLPFPSPEDLPDPGLNLHLLHW